MKLRRLRVRQLEVERVAVETDDDGDACGGERSGDVMDLGGRKMRHGYLDSYGYQDSQAARCAVLLGASVTGRLMTDRSSCGSSPRASVKRG